MSLSGRKAVITGGGRGIGAATAWALSKAGAQVMVASRSSDQIEALAKQLSAAGYEAHWHTLDVADEASVAKLAEAAQNELGQVDILVNNAGVASSAPVKRLTLEDWNHVMAINATGTFLCTRAFIEQMSVRGWGRIVNVASIAARVGAPYISAYTASKHAVLGFTRAAAAEVAAKGVTVNAVCPGYVDTQMTDESVANVVKRSGLSEKDALQAILSSVGQKRLITPDEVAYMVTALCAEQAGGTTGQAIVMDAGGLLA